MSGFNQIGGSVVDSFGLFRLNSYSFYTYVPCTTQPNFLFGVGTATTNLEMLLLARSQLRAFLEGFLQLGEMVHYLQEGIPINCFSLAGSLHRGLLTPLSLEGVIFLIVLCVACMPPCFWHRVKHFSKQIFFRIQSIEELFVVHLQFFL